MICQVPFPVLACIFYMPKLITIPPPLPNATRESQYICLLFSNFICILGIKAIYHSLKNIANHLQSKLSGCYQSIIVRNRMDAKEQSIKVTNDDIISFSGSFSDYFISIVDIVDSTKITSFLSQKQACKYYAIFLNAMAAIVETFGGRIVKNVGDSLLYYFPQKIGFSEKLLAKYSLECGIAMIDARCRINELMKEEHLPSVKYRISVDYGTVMIARETHSTRDDIFGPPVNLCSKINRHAAPNSMVIGGDMHQIARSLEGYVFKQCSDCSTGLKFSYPVYSLERNNPPCNEYL